MFVDNSSFSFNYTLTQHEKSGSNRHLEAVTDMPCANFAEELVQAFPNAKVVLTQWDPESWVKSIETLFYTILSWRMWPFLKWLSPVSHPRL